MKIEPKFKIGDIIQHKSGCKYEIIDIECENGYICYYIDGEIYGDEFFEHDSPYFKECILYEENKSS
jgi:uncharacterized protein YodC (DUF2158 family)